MNLVQVQNPKSRCYVLIDKDKGEIIDFSEPEKPFKDVEILRPEKKDAKVPGN